jgi:hypothetical protein
MAWRKQDKPLLCWFHTDSSSREFVWKAGLDNPFPKQVEQLSLSEGHVLVRQSRQSYQVPLTLPDTLKLCLYKTEKRSGEVFVKAVKALANYHQLPLKQVDKPQMAHWLLSSEEVPGFNGLLFRYQPDKYIAWIEKTPDSSFIIRKLLSNANVLEGGLLTALRPHFLHFYTRHILLPSTDYRQGSLSKRQAVTVSHPTKDPEEDQVASFWLGLLALALFCLERVMAYRISTQPKTIHA